MNAIIQQTELNIFIKAFLERICALERGEILIKKHLTMGHKRRIKRTHRRRVKLKLTGRGGVRAHNRPRPNGKKIRVKH